MKSYGWSRSGQRAQQAQGNKNVITCTLAQTMWPQGNTWMQLIFAGKTPACLPIVDNEIGAYMQVTYTESPLQTAQSYQDFVNFIDESMQQTGQPPCQWLLVIDLARVHVSKEVELPEHCHQLFFPPGSTGYLQPLDVVIFRSFKSMVANRANKHLAKLTVHDTEPLATTFDFGKAAFKKENLSMECAGKGNSACE